MELHTLKLLGPGTCTFIQGIFSITDAQSLMTFASKCQQIQDSSPPAKTQKQLLTRTTAHGVPLHALPVGERGHVGVRVHALFHVAAPHALGAAARAPNVTVMVTPSRSHELKNCKHPGIAPT